MRSGPPRSATKILKVDIAVKLKNSENMQSWTEQRERGWEDQNNTEKIRVNH